VAFANYSHDKFADRMKKAELKNVEETVLEYPKGFSELPAALAKLPAGGFDAIITIRNYHDLKNPLEVLPELKRLLKPGGILGIADPRTWSGQREHRSLPHRRGPDHPRGDGAGFRLAGVSQMLSNPKDDYTPRVLGRALHRRPGLPAFRALGACEPNLPRARRDLSLAARAVEGAAAGLDDAADGGAASKARLSPRGRRP